MEDEQNAVNTGETSAPSENQEAVNDQMEQDVSTEDAPLQEQEQTQDTTQQTPDVDERGIPWKNRAIELERKFNEVPDIIQRTVSEALAKQQTPKQEKYTIEQLEQYAAENPQYRPFVEAKKAEIIQSNVLTALQEQRQLDQKQAQEAQLRTQSEQWVTGHPEFKDCFAQDAYGNKTWNYSNPLTQIIGQVLNSPDPTTGKLVKDRPDGLAIAAEMAYGRYALTSKNRTASQVAKVKKDLRVAQRQTMVTGGARQANTAPANTIRDKVAQYQKSYKKSDLQGATKEFLIKSGLIQEE